MHKSAIVFVAKDKPLPLDFAERVLKKYSSWSGVAILMNGKLHGQNSRDTQTADKLVATRNKFIGNTMIFAFGSEDTEFRNEDMQPFKIMEDGGKKPMILALTAGQWPGFVRAGSNTSPDKNFADTYLTPKIAELYELSENKMDGLWNMLKKPRIKTDMTAQSIGESNVVLINNQGNVLVFPKDSDVAPYNQEWGWHTDHSLAQTELPIEEEPEGEDEPFEIEDDTVVVEEEPNIFDVEEAPAPTKEAKEGKPDTKVNTNKDKKTITVASTDPIRQPPPSAEAVEAAFKKLLPPQGRQIGIQSDQRGEIFLTHEAKFMYQPNTKLHGKTLKGSYRTMTGSEILPEDPHWSTHPLVEIVDLGRIRELKGKLFKDSRPPTAEAEVRPPSKTAAEKQQQQQRQARRTALDKPALSASDIAQVKAKFHKPEVKQAIDDHANDITDPTDLAAYEEKIPEAAELVGYDGGTNGTLKWSYDTYLEWCMNHPRWAAQLMMDYRFKYLSSLSPEEFKKVMGPSKKKEQPTDKVAKTA